MKKTVIAELCQNHNGDKNLVSEMVAAAKESGADFAKMQYIRSDSLSHRPRFDNGLSDGSKRLHIKRPFSDELARLKTLDIPDTVHESFLQSCRDYDINPMVTVFTLDDVERVFNLGYSNIKLSSFDCSSYPLVSRVASHQQLDYLVISTGCSFKHEITKSISLASVAPQLSVLHCVSIYPTPIYEAHLSRIQWLHQHHSSVGVSDHTNPEVDSHILATAASYLGAEVIEKHFTILPKDQTKDGPVSVNPPQLTSLVKSFKSSQDDQIAFLKDNLVDLTEILGDADRELSETELLNRDYYQGRFCNTHTNGSFYYNWDCNE